MTSGFGVDATLDGNGGVLSGTSAADIRKIWGGLLSPGIISGCAVTTSTTAMSYNVAAGVVAIKAANGEIIPAPVDSVTVPTSAAPASGSRTDIIYAMQRYPSIEGDSNIVVGVATTLPARAVALRKMTVSAGQTKTSLATQSGGIDYSIPYGASLGTLQSYRDTTMGTFVAAQTLGSKSIYLPTDRLLRVSILTSVSADGANGFDASKYCEAGYDFMLDGVKQWRWNTPGLHQAWAHYFWSDVIQVSAGTHTVAYSRYRVVGPGTPFHRYVVQDMPGTLFTVEDVGPVV